MRPTQPRPPSRIAGLARVRHVVCVRACVSGGCACLVGGCVCACVVRGGGAILNHYTINTDYITYIIS